MGSTKPDKTLLTPREAEIQALHALGLSYREIAARLGIGHGTVHKHLHSIRERAMRADNMTYIHNYLDSQAIEESKSKGIANTNECSCSVTQVEQ
jgi:DNA-binding NarL/FixJ family response regulator